MGGSNRIEPAKLCLASLKKSVQILRDRENEV